MIERNKYQLNYIKKENQSGSYQGMRFTFSKGEENLTVIAYPEPWCLAATPEDRKIIKTFPFSGEGLDAAVDWLNELYTKKEDYWKESYEKRMQV
jgi:hypothetical protein